MLESSRRQRVASDITAQLPPGTFNLNIDQTALILGCHPGHIRNQISDGDFPIHTITLGKRRLIPLTGLIDYLVAVIESQHPTKARRGRRTKAAQRIFREQQEHANAGNARRGV